VSEPGSAARQQAERFFATWNSEGARAAAERFWHSEIRWEEPPGFPDAGVHRGREACLRRMEERFDLLGEVRIEVADAQLVGDQALIDAIVHGRGAASGAPTEMRDFFLIENRGRRTIRFREFLERDEALAAARASAGRTGRAG
jgi:ketosteroid isomerase-like protein